MKIIKVKNCACCPNSKFDGLKVLFCESIPPIGKEIKDKHSIPDWCPLEDEKYEKWKNGEIDAKEFVERYLWSR